MTDTQQTKKQAIACGIFCIMAVKTDITSLIPAINTILVNVLFKNLEVQRKHTKISLSTS